MQIILQITLLFFIFLVMYSYLIYPVLLFLLSRIFRKKVKFDKQYFPSVGVVVPVYNEEKVILKKIENLLSLEYPADKLSIWIGSDNSTDQTNKLVSSFNDSRIHLWIAEKRGGKTEILNNVVPVVDSEIIFLTDANTIHHPDCLLKMVGFYADEKVGAVAGRVDYITKGSKEFAEVAYRSFEVWQKELESQLHSSISAFGGFYTIRKDLFKQIPYNAYSNDDVLIPMNIIRKGKRVIFNSNALSSEDITGSIKSEFSRRIRIGAGNFQVFFWLLDFLSPLKGWPAFCFISHKAIRFFSSIFLSVSYILLVVLSIITPFYIYRLLFGVGSIFLLLACSYMVFRFKIIRPFHYFLVMNVALLLGFFRYMRGIKSAVWARTDRD